MRPRAARRVRARWLWLIALALPACASSPPSRTETAAIRQIREEGVTLLVADQNVKFARRVADRGYIMEKGHIRYSDRLEALWANEDIVRKYLAV